MPTIIIQQKRIRKLPKDIQELDTGSDVILGIPVSEENVESLKRIGFDYPSGVGTQIVPSKVGPVTRRNAEGSFVIHKDQPMETAYRQAEWHWQQYGPGGVLEDHSAIVDIPYKRRPRTFIPPLGMELKMISVSGKTLVVSPKFIVGEKEEQLIIGINIFLEAFGMSQVLNSDLAAVELPVARRLNWQILPEGKMPWKAMQRHLDPVINSASKGNRVVIASRFEVINEYGPSFTAKGLAGFQGYVVFGFPNLGIFVLESMFHGNATYILGEDWKTLSQLSKGELIGGNLIQGRVVHRLGWRESIDSILGRKRKAS